MKKLIKKPFKFQEGGTSPQTSPFGTPENPIELEGIEVTAKKLNWLEKRWNDIKWAFRNVVNDINRDADRFVANHRRAEERNPNYNRDWDMLNNINEFVNTATGGFWKNSSPSQLVGTVAHIVRGEPVLDSWMNFNNGVVGAINEDWANEHPYLTMAGNIVFDGMAFNAKPIARGTVNTVNTAKNAKDLYYGFQHGNIYKISTNPLLKQIFDSPITERFLTKTQPGKRALETIMRTTSAPNPIPETLSGMQKLPWKPRINYILFGKNPKLRRLFGQPNMHYGDNSWSSRTIIPYTIDGGKFGSIDAPITLGGNVYTGLVDNTGNIVIGKGYGDIIDAYLYGTTIDPKIATLSTNNAGRQFFDNYILRNYPNKNIKSYTVKGDVDPKTIMKTSEWEGRSDTFAEEFRTNDNKAAINVAGHNYQSGWTDPSSRFPQVQRGFDIWKFNPEEYHNKWNVGNNYLESRGLELVDKAGTPIIFEQPWKLIAR